MDVNTANQSTTDEQMMDILLVLDKEKKTISAVKGVDENGELQTVPPENNSELLKFDRHGDFFSNFFSNMMNQLKNPTRFNFFRIPKIELPKITPIIRDNFDHPTAKNEAEIERYRVTPETLKQGVTNGQPNQTQQQVQQPQQEATAQAPQQPDKSKYIIDPDKVDWEALKNFGLSKEQLEKAKALEPMLRGYKSPGAFSACLFGMTRMGMWFWRYMASDKSRNLNARSSVTSFPKRIKPIFLKRAIWDG